MSANPWLKFYPRDWRGDQALRAVSISARGLWIECLCIMHEAKPYGHLLLNGNPVDDGTLARMTGVPVDEVSAMIAELRQAGVLSVTGKGVVFSRRMTKDHARAQKGRLSVKKRWQQASGGVEQSEAPNRAPNRAPITQKPEARSQKESISAKAPKVTPKGELQKVLDEERAKAVVEHRAKIKKPLTVHAAKLLAKRLGETPDPNLSADTMIERGWLGFKPEWIEGAANGRTRGNGNGWIIVEGSPEYSAWRDHYAVENSKHVYEFPIDKPGHEARAPCRWPSQLKRG